MTIPYDSDPNQDGFTVAGAAEEPDAAEAVEEEDDVPEEPLDD